MLLVLKLLVPLTYVNAIALLGSLSDTPWALGACNCRANQVAVESHRQLELTAVAVRRERPPEAGIGRSENWYAKRRGGAGRLVENTTVGKKERMRESYVIVFACSSIARSLALSADLEHLESMDGGECSSSVPKRCLHNVVTLLHLASQDIDDLHSFLFPAVDAVLTMRTRLVYTLEHQLGC